MDVFISWSGHVSRQVAESLGSFVQHVVSGATTFVSAQDIDIGEPWDSRLNLELARTNHAILCLTRDNQGAPWINYEAGVLGKLLTRSRVIPYTIGFPPNELAAGSPLSRFQGVRNDEHGTWKLVNALNTASLRPKSESFVKEGFAMFCHVLARVAKDHVGG